jgi:hypothetical protein
VKFKSVFLILCLTFLMSYIPSIGISATESDVDKTVWIMVRHECSAMPYGTVVVEILKSELNCTLDECPDTAIDIIGEGYDTQGNFTGMHLVIIEKDYLRDKKHWTYEKPKTKPIKANNLWIWEV